MSAGRTWIQGVKHLPVKLTIVSLIPIAVSVKMNLLHLVIARSFCSYFLLIIVIIVFDKERLQYVIISFQTLTSATKDSHCIILNPVQNYIMSIAQNYDMKSWK